VTVCFLQKSKSLQTECASDAPGGGTGFEGRTDMKQGNFWGVSEWELADQHCPWKVDIV